MAVKVGNVNATKLGVPRFDRHDAYHLILSLSWPAFFGGAVLVYMVVNMMFAVAYYLGDHAVAHADPNHFSDYFFFSIETLATVGYGVMSPDTLYGHLIATIEIITGMLTLAVTTSLVFARFSKPTARILFSKVAVITPFNGVPTLTLRVANQRSSYILEAAATLTLLRLERTTEGENLRRFHDLTLERKNSPVFILSWSIRHAINESSPLYGVTEQDFIDGDMRLMVTLRGVDETFAASISARHDYAHEDIRFGSKFVDIVQSGDDRRRIVLDFAKFHDIE